jgi:hypothetical protein
MAYIIRILLAFWMTSAFLCSRQLRRFYEKRVEGKQTEMELFFQEEGVQTVLPSEGKQKAIKLLQMIQALGKATFVSVRRWWGHRVTSFMAAPLYHGARVAKTE